MGFGDWTHGNNLPVAPLEVLILARPDQKLLETHLRRVEDRAGVAGFNSSNCSGVGQTSGLPVHGASGSVNLVRSEHRAGGPANRQTRGLPHPPT
ncbi:MAG: hypothetical protein ABSH34_18075 [Verrucomicrobiota bacterium]